MVSDLLFGVIPDLPASAVTIRHTCISDARRAFKESQRDLADRNIEAVFRAIADDYATNEELQEATGLAKATVFNACVALLIADRVTVDKTRRPHTYFVKEK
jgi:hypothetical protein